jgi:pimeloyl-ACP methyl ester carboxylesterase
MGQALFRSNLGSAGGLTMKIAGAVSIVAVALAAGVAAEPRSAFMTASDGVRIHYLTVGDAGSPVVLIHGYTANAEGKWMKSGIAQALGARHRVIAIDARGHGQSDKPHDPAKYGPRMATDVLELMDHLKIARAHIHGYSMGGSILTQILARAPERVITAIYGGSGPQETDPAWQAKVPKDPEPPAAGDPKTPRGERWSAYPGFDRAALDAVQKYPWKPGERDVNLPALMLPMLAIVGELDRPNARTHRLSRESRNFTLLVLPGETHGSAHLNPNYTSALVKFIDRHDR